MQRLIVNSHQVGSGQIHLTQPQQHYLYRVLRLAPGDQFVALDGLGCQWIAALTERPQVAAISETLTLSEPPVAAITLVIALPKGNGFDEVVRQTTELGVTTLQPVITERTLHQPNPKKLERWQRIATEATEQSERLLLPQILAPLPWADYLKQVTPGSRWLCVARHQVPHLLTVAQTAGQANHPTDAMVIATGPEGGWTEAEIAAARNVGFQTVSLGSHILRAVTAPLAALALVTAARDARASLHYS